MANVQLPNAQDMLERLLRVSRDAYLIENLYPKFLERAGQHISATGLGMMIGMAFEEARHALPDEGVVTLDPLAPLFMEALVDDRDFLAAAKRLWNPTSEG